MPLTTLVTLTSPCRLCDGRPLRSERVPRDNDTVRALLDRHGTTYAEDRRYDERTSTQLGELADTVLDRYAGDLRTMHARSEDLEQDLQQLTGIGPAGAAIFCREVQGAWGDLAPYVDELTAKVVDDILGA